MQNGKKHLARRLAALILALAAMSMTGCERLVPDEAQRVTLYATFYPIYALTDAVVRDVPDLALRCLVQPQDGCLRAYALSDWDAAILSRGASAIIAGGRGLESFERTLFAWGDAGPAVAAVLYNLELYNEADATGADPEYESHFRGANPHLYLSLAGAREIVESVCAAMQALDPDYADAYIANAQRAEARLEALLNQTRGDTAALAGRRAILMNEALVYPATDCALTVAGWIERESGEAMTGEALEKCLARLSEMEAEVVLIEKQAPGALVDALEAAGYAVARLDVLSTHREGEGFDEYLEIMRGNVRAIREAFERADAGRDGQ